MSLFQSGPTRATSFVDGDSVSFDHQSFANVMKLDCETFNKLYTKSSYILLRNSKEREQDAQLY